MADKAKVKRRLDLMAEKLEELGPLVAENWGGSILYKVTDLNTGWLMKFDMDGTVESLEESVDEGAASSIIETDSDRLLGILNGDINPSAARAEGTLRAKKSLEALAMIVPACIGPVDL